MCSSQIAKMAADRLNASFTGRNHGVRRFVALPHTEGCGFAGDAMYALLRRTYSGYATHSAVAAALLLEHGCEKVVNDVMRHEFASRHIDASAYGWASVQLDGGISKTLDKIETWFVERLSAMPPGERTPTGLNALTLGILSDGEVRPSTAVALGTLSQTVVSAGGSVLLVENDPLLLDSSFCALTLGGAYPLPTLTYGEAVKQPGFHIVRTETNEWIENVTGLGGCGVQVMLGIVRESVRPGHPFVPVLQVVEPGSSAIASEDVDAVLRGVAEPDLETMLGLVLGVAGGRQEAVASRQGNVDFQLTRGLLGVST
jgi:altronate dehydratase